MSYPTFPACEECERLRAEVEALKGALTAAHDQLRTAERWGWNAAIDTAARVVNNLVQRGSSFRKDAVICIRSLRKPAP